MQTGKSSSTRPLSQRRAARHAPPVVVADVGGSGARSPDPWAHSSFSGGAIVKYLLLILFDGLALWGIIRMIDLQAWLPLAITVVGALAVNLVYWGRERIPGKYLLPMAIVLTLFAVIPVMYNVYISFTNSGTGNLITKEQAIDRLESQTLPASDDARVFRAEVVRDGDSFTFIFAEEETGMVFVGDEDGLEEAAPGAAVLEDGRLVSFDGEPVLNLAEKQDNKDAILSVVVPTETGFPDRIRDVQLRRNRTTQLLPEQVARGAAQPRAARRPMQLDCLGGIARTARLETAASREQG